MDYAAIALIMVFVGLIVAALIKRGRALRAGEKPADRPRYGIRLN